MNEIINVCLEKMGVVRMVVRRRISEDVFDGSLSGFLYNGVCSCFCM